MTKTIAHVNVARGYRGGERQTELLIRELARYDVDQVLVARRAAPLAERLNDADVRIREVSGQIPGVTTALRGVDLAHVHEGRSVYAGYLRWVLTKTPYILTRRVDNPVKEHWFAHQAYRHAVYVAAVSPQVADIVGAYDGRIRLEVIVSGSSSLSFDAASTAAIRERFAGKLLVGHVGALDVKQKAQDVIIEVARQLEASHPEIQFVLVGRGDDEAVLREAAAGLGNLAFTGFVDNVGDYLKAFDIFILPSRKEGLGSISLDAMQYSLPVIASRVGGVPEIVKDRYNGLLIYPERPDELAAAIVELYAQPQFRLELGNRGEALARRFTARVMCEKYVSLYETVLGPIQLLRHD
jgi:glycosyltransferase involved in cell wall biosynthesis